MDTRNKTFYDHPVDHVPGLVLIEAATQAAHTITGPGHPLPRTISTTYDRYVEFDSACRLDATVTPASHGGWGIITVTGSQNDLRAFRVVLTY
ncbi:AfsA-related hotdog domain-containing protein [Streptomyces sp. NPDC058653]|uniref:AfsA-related hotdog domain-containing protein n=1 Tax=Streptomyces sp. NPDC058653 TaxID=3346576 RepID=UPI0036590A8D